MKPIFTFLVVALLAQAKTLSVAWSQTPEAFAGRLVRITLMDNTKIEGSWIRVTPDSVTMKVNSSSSVAIGPGTRTILRSKIQRLGLRKRHVSGRVVGTIAGFLTAGFATAGVSATQGNSDANAGAGLIALAGGAGGYWIGRHFDKDATDEVLVSPP